MKIESRFVTGGAAKAVAASAPMAPTASQDPVITLQQALANHGYDVAVDGVFGVGTENAVRDFQSNNGLEVDGVVGAATYYELTGQFCLAVHCGVLATAVMAVARWSMIGPNGSWALPISISASPMSLAETIRLVLIALALPATCTRR